MRMRVKRAAIVKVLKMAANGLQERSDTSLATAE
jgi:hypothetical protein